MPRISISILCFNQLETTRECFDHLKRHADLSQVELLLTDNGSADGTRAFLTACNLPNTKILHHESNVGFGPGHNYALQEATGKYFVMLNNDLFVEENQWLTKLLARLSDLQVALVGLSDTPRTLHYDGNGYVGPKVDYVDGACAAGRTTLFRKYGLFSPTLPMFAFEDSDLSLRYRQAGFRIEHVKIKHQHHRGASRKGIDPDRRREITSRNQQVFLKRWGTYLKTGTFTNRILVRITSWGIGDTIAMTPVINGLRKDHPTARIDVACKHTDVFINNPDVHQCKPNMQTGSNTYDRIIDLDPNYAGPKPIVRECAEIAATPVDRGTPRIFLAPEETQWAESMLKHFLNQNRPVVICHFALHHARDWHGRSWPLEHAWEFVNRLRVRWGNAVGVVEVGQGVRSTGRAHIDVTDKTSLRQLFALVSKATLVVGIDSVVSHVARAFGKRSVILFGATEPGSRILDTNLEQPVQREDVSCVGCYQRKADPDLNACKQDQRCMNITGDAVFRIVDDKLRCRPG